MSVGSTLRLVVVDALDNALLWDRLRGRAEMGESRGPSESAPDGEARRTLLGLTPIWRAGAFSYTATRAADAWLAAGSWAEALQWSARLSDRTGRAIGSLQIWCHGGWGSVRLGATRLDTTALERDHDLASGIDALRERLAGREALLWFRCCSAFGHTGRRFAAATAARFGCRVAGHTHIIGFFQSGLHSLAPGDEPTWDRTEGVRFAEGHPTGALSSSPRAPNTITCLRSTLPQGY